MSSLLQQIIPEPITIPKRSQFKDFIWLTSGYLLSFFLHYLLFFYSFSNQSLETQAWQAIEIELFENNSFAAKEFPEEKLVVPTELKIIKQVVPPSPSDSETSTKNTNLVSSVESHVTKEQIKRGDPLAGNKDSGAKQIARATSPFQGRKTGKPAAQKSTKTASADIKITPTPSLAGQDRETLTENQLPPSNEHGNDNRLSFLLKTGDIPNESDNSAGNSRTTSLDEYQPFRKGNPHSLFSGKYGDADNLPQIPDGDITLLNAKADKNAVFIRRIGLQIFAALRKITWANLTARRVASTEDFATVTSVLSANGEFIKAKLTESSGNPSFDYSLTQAAEIGSWDQNPPISALDGNGQIKLTLKSRIWVRQSPNKIGERRWLLLSVGLE